VLDNLNALRQRQGLAELASVGELFAQVDATLLTTFAELDHFPNRSSGRHIGVFPFPEGRPPNWPCKARRRALVYHKPHSLLQRIVDELTRQEIATILYTGSDDSQIVEHYSTKYVRVTTDIVDLRPAMQQSDFAVLNGTHATTVAALLAGKPSIHFPLVLEQWMFAQRVKQLGAGNVVPANSPRSISNAIEEITACIPVAQRFAARYASFDTRIGLRSAIASVETQESRGAALCPETSRSRACSEH
jgi:UDP:flavonoid glycosyltransferase YjiC (YdhE family)